MGDVRQASVHPEFGMAETPTLWILDDALKRLHVASTSRKRDRSIGRMRLETYTAEARTRSDSAREQATPRPRPVTTTCVRPLGEAITADDEEYSAQLDEISIAVEAFQEFKTEVKEWVRAQEEEDSHKSIEPADFADYLTDKYLCRRLDPLGRSDAVIRIRKSIISQIDKLCRPSPAAAPSSLNSPLSSIANKAPPRRGPPLPDADLLFRRGTASKTISEARRFLIEGQESEQSEEAIAAAAVSTSPGGPPAAASPPKKAAARADASSSGDNNKAEEEEEEAVWRCQLCTKKNGPAAARCAVCGRARDAGPTSGSSGAGSSKVMPFAGRIGAGGLSASLVEKLKAFQRSTVRAEKDAASCEDLGREIKGVLSTLRAIQTADPPTTQAGSSRK